MTELEQAARYPAAGRFANTMIVAEATDLQRAFRWSRDRAAMALASVEAASV